MAIIKPDPVLVNCRKDFINQMRMLTDYREDFDFNHFEWVGRNGVSVSLYEDCIFIRLQYHLNNDGDEDFLEDEARQLVINIPGVERNDTNTDGKLFEVLFTIDLPGNIEGILTGLNRVNRLKGDSYAY